MQKVLDYLKELGFSKIEAQIYLTLLTNGPLTVKGIAKIIKVNRTASYAPINSLVEKGVLIEITSNARKQLAAIEPDQLHYLIDRRLDSVNILKNKFPEFINKINLSLHRKAVDEKVVVKYYQGKNNAIALYKEALQAKSLRTYVKILEYRGFFQDGLHVFREALKQNKNLRIKEIIYDSTKSTQKLLNIHMFAKSNNAYSYKIMPPHVKLAGNDILIFDNKVVIIEFTETIKCIVLQSESYYNNFKELFDFNWQILPEPENNSKNVHQTL